MIDLLQFFAIVTGGVSIALLGRALARANDRVSNLERKLYPTADEAAEHRRQAADMSFKAAPISPDLRAKLDRLGRMTHE